MMGLDQLIDTIADVLWAGVKAQHLPAICTGFGLESGEESEAFGSKRGYVRKRLVGRSKEQLVELANSVLKTFPAESLQKVVEQFDTIQLRRISEITRQHLLRDVCALGSLEGKLDLLDFLGRLWPIASMPSSGNDLRCLSAQDEISQHMIHNYDYSHVEMFELLGLASMSNKKLIEFLELSVHPLVRVDEDQDRYVELINGHLKQDGLALVASETVSGFPVFRIAQIVGGVCGSAKNLIFASAGPKPEIVFSDAVNNDIQVVGNAEFCLIYDQPFPKNGLSWNHLVSWWAAKTGCQRHDIETERTLYLRLHESLQSAPERLLFKSYFASFRPQMGDKLPALIPQVYLHYDPYTARQLRGEKRIPRQRMDFLLLLSSFERIVVEVDGRQHYSDEGQAAPDKYAEMVSADRDLRLAGYEVYRFGGAELMGERGTAVVSEFFTRLFAKHDIRIQGVTPATSDAARQCAEEAFP